MRATRRAFLGVLASSLATPSILRARPTTVNAASFGAVGDGRTDATEALNRAAAAVRPGGTLRIPSGRYLLSSSLVVHGGTVVEAPQAFLTNGPHWREAMGLGTGPGPGFALVTNANHRAAAITDHDLHIVGLSCAYTGPPRGQAHAVQFRMVENVVIEGCHFHGGGNGTALLACRKTKVAFSTAISTYNAGFDHWEGPQRATVHDCTVVCARGYGILFSGAGTNVDKKPRSAAGFIARGNRIQGPTEAGIWVAPLSRGSTVTGILLDGNAVDVAGEAGAGIGVSGAASDVVIENNTITNTVVGNPIFARPGRSGRPRNIHVLNNKIVNCSVSKLNVAAVELVADAASASGNVIDGGNFPVVIWTDGNDNVIEKTFVNHSIYSYLYQKN